MNSGINYVCVATEMKLYLPYLKKLIPDLVILGLNEKWEGFITKYKLLKHYLSLNEIDDDTLICFIDAYDVLPTKNIIYFERKYKEFIKNHQDVKMIVGYDIADNVVHEHLCQDIFGTVDDIRLNSGQFIGTAKNIKNVINYILDNTSNFQTDQIELTKYANKFKKDVYIDINHDFFYVKSRPLKQVLLPITGLNSAVAVAGPAFIHANGNGFLDDFLFNEHSIRISIKERILHFIENLRGALRKVIIYDLIYIKKHLLLFYNLLLNFFMKNIMIKNIKMNDQSINEYDITHPLLQELQ